MMNAFEKSINEACGVFAVYGNSKAANLVYYGLHSLQHRGQEGAGIVSIQDGQFQRIKGKGLVIENFNEANLATLKGNMALGHVLYANNDDFLIENIQPLVFHNNEDNFAISYNGGLVNKKELRQFLESRGNLFQTTSDAEIIAHLIKMPNHTKDYINSIKEALTMLEGAFAFCIMTKDKIYACRDRHGMKPLSIGKIDGGYVVSSETCAFEVIGAEFVKDVAPGEIVVIDENGYNNFEYSQYRRHKVCAMEYVYFSRPDSDIDGMNVHTFRKNSGKILFREQPVSADICIGVPDSSLSAAMGYAEASGIPYEMGLIKNKYIGRTFIFPKQTMREKGVRMKISAVSSIVSGKKVILVDDSIIRGTTSRKIIAILKEAGAKEVHVRIASQNYQHPCFYGVGTGTYDELIGFSKSVEEIKELIGADSLGYLSKKGVMEAANGVGLCLACFTGEYPTPIYSNTKKEK